MFYIKHYWAAWSWDVEDDATWKWQQMQKAMVSSAKSAMVRGKEWTQCKGRKTSYASHHHHHQK